MKALMIISLSVISLTFTLHTIKQIENNAGLLQGMNTINNVFK